MAEFFGIKNKDNNLNERHWQSEILIEMEGLRILRQEQMLYLKISRNAEQSVF